jgi:nucleotide-binding universal stress UspA family protein
VNKILVALDNSTRARGVLAAAAELARKFDATLHVVRVITIPPEFPASAAGSPSDPLPAHLTTLALADLARLLAEEPGAKLHPPFVVVGQPWRSILELGRTLDVDLIVLGSHGYSGWDHMLGTTAGKVANLADRNVLVIHEHHASAGAQQVH